MTPAEIVLSHATTVPVNLSKIANALGARIHMVDSMDDSLSGMIVRNDDGSYDISVNASHPRNRQRFTIAHELAHLVLHQPMIGDGIVDDAMYRSKLSDFLEREADSFAAAILMPANLVREAYKKDKAIHVLAELFQVSHEAMKYRLINLRLGA